MIRQYHPHDLKKIKMNSFSAYNESLEDLNHVSFYKNTLVDGASVMGILAFRRYWKDNYVCFILMAEGFNARHGRQVKRFIDNAMIDFGAKRLQTDSANHPALNRWHKFLGFQLEGTRKKLIYDTDFNMWALFGKEQENGN